MNFPRKNPMKMAAITTRREGRGLVTLSLKDAAEVDPGLSECATFLSRKPSSWGENTQEIFKTNTTHRSVARASFLQTERRSADVYGYK